MTHSDEKLRTDRLALYQADIERIDRCLEEFLNLSGSKCAVLIDQDGHLVTHKGELHADLDTISALVAGSFAATRQMAKLLGEGEFNSLYHQGVQEHLLIHLVGNRSLLTVIFDQNTTLGMVRLYAAEAAKRLASFFEEAMNRTQEPASPFSSDPTAAKDQIDKILG